MDEIVCAGYREKYDYAKMRLGIKPINVLPLGFIAVI